MASLSRATVWLLIAVHVFLLAWALVGLAEFVVPAVPWPRISNPLFPDWVLLAQWLLIGPTALVFLAGYAARWPHMPLALGIGYGGMASLCAYQTFTLLTHETRFVDMALEYAAYLAILIFLSRSRHVRERLGSA